MNERQEHLRTFLAALSHLEDKVGGKLQLKNCHGRMNWPSRGVYFFFEGNRVVRVGTHALKNGSKTSLWKRLSQHRGIVKSGGGNHRGSIFRLLVGDALLISDNNTSVPSWGVKGDISKAAIYMNQNRDDLNESEFSIEKLVTAYIGNLPFLYLNISDAADPFSKRGLIEKNSIALLSNYNTVHKTEHPSNWLGNFSSRERVRKSSLWNNNHVNHDYDPAFLSELEKYISQTESAQ